MTSKEVVRARTLSPRALVDRLNVLLALDPCAIRTLLEATAPCNPDLIRAAGSFAFDSSHVRFLGLLNMALLPQGVTVAVRYDAVGNPIRFEVLLP